MTRAISASHRLCALLFVIVTVGALTGCATPTPWQSAFVGNAAVPLAENAPVRVREVPWERVEATLVALNAELAAADVHPDEWTRDRRDASKAALLRGLQISEPPELVAILGRSEFRTTDAIRPATARGEADLTAFARSVGADTVVWSARPLGKADRIVHEPVTAWSTGRSDWPWWSDGRRPRRDRFYSESSTAWVPVRIQVEETGFIAFFLQTPAAQ